MNQQGHLGLVSRSISSKTQQDTFESTSTLRTTTAKMPPKRKAPATAGGSSKAKQPKTRETRVALREDFRNGVTNKPMGAKGRGACVSGCTVEERLALEHETAALLASDANGTPRMIADRNALLSIWWTFVTAHLHQDVDATPTMDMFYQFVVHSVTPPSDGGPAVFSGRAPDAYTALADVPIVPDFQGVRQRLVTLCKALTFQYDGFRPTRFDHRKVDSLLKKLLAQGKMDDRIRRENRHVDLHHSVEMLAIVLAKCISEGVRSWDVVIVKMALFVMLISTGMRAGDVNVSSGWDPKEYGTTCGDVTIHWRSSDSVLVMKLELRHTKNTRQNKRKIKTLMFQSKSPGGLICPIRWIGLVALRSGNVPYTSWDHMMRSMKSSTTGIMEWKRGAKSKPLFPAFSKNGTLQPDRHTGPGTLLKVVNWIADNAGLVYRGVGWLRTHDFRRGNANQASYLSNDSGPNEAAARRMLGHTEGTAAQGTTANYQGLVQDDVYAKRAAAGARDTEENLLGIDDPLAALSFNTSGAEKLTQRVTSRSVEAEVARVGGDVKSEKDRSKARFTILAARRQHVNGSIFEELDAGDTCGQAQEEQQQQPTTPDARTDARSQQQQQQQQQGPAPEDDNAGEDEEESADFASAMAQNSESDLATELNAIQQEDASVADTQAAMADAAKGAETGHALLAELVPSIDAFMRHFSTVNDCVLGSLNVTSAEEDIVAATGPVLGSQNAPTVHWFRCSKCNVYRNNNKKSVTTHELDCKGPPVAAATKPETVAKSRTKGSYDAHMCHDAEDCGDTTTIFTNLTSYHAHVDRFHGRFDPFVCQEKGDTEVLVTIDPAEPPKVIVLATNGGPEGVEAETHIQHEYQQTACKKRFELYATALAHLNTVHGLPRATAVSRLSGHFHPENSAPRHRDSYPSGRRRKDRSGGRAVPAKTKAASASTTASSSGSRVDNLGASA